MTSSIKEKTRTILLLACLETEVLLSPISIAPGILEFKRILNNKIKEIVSTNL